MSDLSTLRKALERMRLNASDSPGPFALATSLIATGLRYRRMARHLEEASRKAHSPTQLRMLENAEGLDEAADECHRKALELLEPGFLPPGGIPVCRICNGTGTAMLLASSEMPPEDEPERTVSTLAGPCLCRPARAK